MENLIITDRQKKNICQLKNLLIISTVYKYLMVYEMCVYFQNLSCGRELASLLISLYPVCLQKLGPDQKENMTVKNTFIAFSKDSCSMEDIPR